MSTPKKVRLKALYQGSGGRQAWQASDTGAKWYLCYLKEDLVAKEALKRAQDRPKPSMMKPRKRKAANISLQKEILGKKFLVD